MSEWVDEGKMQQRLRNAANMCANPVSNRTNVDGPQPRTRYGSADVVLQRRQTVRQIFKLRVEANLPVRTYEALLAKSNLLGGTRSAKLRLLPAIRL